MGLASAYLLMANCTKLTAGPSSKIETVINHFPREFSSFLIINILNNYFFRFKITLNLSPYQ